MGKTRNELQVGDSASYTKTFTDLDVRTFAEVSGDHNPVHLDEEYAKKTQFGARLVHGALVSSLFSTVLGTSLPGEGSIYLAQNSSFRKPVYLGDTITATVTVIEKIEEKGFVKLSTIATNQKGEKVVVGDALILPRKA